MEFLFKTENNNLFNKIQNTLSLLPDLKFFKAKNYDSFLTKTQEQYFDLLIYDVEGEDNKNCVEIIEDFNSTGLYTPIIFFCSSVEKLEEEFKNNGIVLNNLDLDVKIIEISPTLDCFIGEFISYIQNLKL